MKSLFLLVSLFFVFSAQSQRKTFVRVFDDKGKMTQKGFLIDTSDSTLTLMQNNKYYNIPVTKISIVKLKRSAGHTMLMSSLIGGIPFAILGAVSSETDSYITYSAGGGALAGFIMGAAVAGVVGGVIVGTQKKTVFTINMNKEQWMKVKTILDTYLIVQEK